jgi:NAD(P)-dependent dehydrogenase (short-subunit alcohol dehydrogenase family)
MRTIYATPNILSRSCSAKEVLSLFQTNVFGVLTITRAVLPYMRARRTGTIINIGSASSFLIFPTSGVYSATKAAVSALTRTLRQEVAPLGIKVTVVDLGSLRTNVVNSRVKVEHKIDDFQPTLGPVSAMLDKLVAESKGDPAKAAQLLVEAATQTGRCLGRELPTCLPLGDFEAYRQAHLEADAKELDAWKDFTRSEQVNFDEAE